MPIESLRPYQEEGVRFLKKTKRAMLFDQVGLGKTIQAIRAAQDYGPILVACPAFLTRDWYEVLHEQFPEDRIAYANGTRDSRLLALVTDAKWTIITHDMLRRVYDSEKKTWSMSYPLVRKYRTVIIDESHHFAGHNSQRSAGAAWLTTQPHVERVYLLTASPVRRDVDDFYMQLHLIAPDVFGSYWTFVQKWTRSFKAKFQVQIFGVKNPARFKKEVLAPYALGRNAKQVKLQIPKVISKRMLVTLSPEELANYRSIKKDYRTADGALKYDNPSAVLQALRRVAACEAKLQAVADLVEQTRAQGVIVFTWNQSTAHAIAERLGVEAITGELNASKRTARAAEDKVTVATIASMGEGVNVLAGRQTCIFAEEDYTPKSRLQAIGRVQRWSEQMPESVRVYYVMAKGTVDERIHAAAEGRIASLREIIDLELQEEGEGSAT